MSKKIAMVSKVFVSFLLSAFLLLGSVLLVMGEEASTLDLGISSRHYEEGRIPRGWSLRSRFGFYRVGEARWVKDDGQPAVRFHSKGALTFLERDADIDIKEFQVVTWKWKVVDVLKGVDERVFEGDDHPIRIFFVFAPTERSFWFRVKRFFYLDRVHGHPAGGRFIEYLWSSNLEPGEIIDDPLSPRQKLMVVEAGSANAGKWLSYRRNLYEDYKSLYGEEPSHLIFIGILNDTDQTGQEATSYIADLTFHKPLPQD
ncbi:MAG: DUF3047 domain-containing protein [Deltaproteobacteria bacterium]|nr:DUF3047 domain-containing protein [Deltaproteobacteria bacterium]